MKSRDEKMPQFERGKKLGAGSMSIVSFNLAFSLCIVFIKVVE